MLDLLRATWRTISTREGRLALRIAWSRNLPGKPGYVVRSRLYSQVFASCGSDLFVFEGVRIRNPHKIRVGHHVQIGEEAFLQAGGGLTMGDWVMLGPGVKIWTQNHRYDDPDVPIDRQGVEYREVVIGDDCWLGANCFLMPGTRLGRGCVVAACSVVGAKNYPDYSIIMGHPARVIGSRRPQEQPQ
jgi:acetyltransferase-like isoleucine patch superfamily enzyme